MSSAFDQLLAAWIRVALTRYGLCDILALSDGRTQLVTLSGLEYLPELDVPPQIWKQVRSVFSERGSFEGVLPGGDVYAVLGMPDGCLGLSIFLKSQLVDAVRDSNSAPFLNVSQLEGWIQKVLQGESWIVVGGARLHRYLVSGVLAYGVSRALGVWTQDPLLSKVFLPLPELASPDLMQRIEMAQHAGAARFLLTELEEEYLFRLLTNRLQINVIASLASASRARMEQYAAQIGQENGLRGALTSVVELRVALNGTISVFEPGQIWEQERQCALPKVWVEKAGRNEPGWEIGEVLDEVPLL